MSPHQKSIKPWAATAMPICDGPLLHYDLNLPAYDSSRLISIGPLFVGAGNGTA